MDEMKDFPALAGIEESEGQVVELSFKRKDVELSGNGGIDFDGFLSDTLSPCLGQVMQRAQIMQPIGKLDHKHTQTPARTQEDLAVSQVLYSGFVQPVAPQLRAPVDQFRHGIAELTLDVFRIDLRYVFDYVMKQSSGKQMRVFESQFPGKDLGNRAGMADIGGPRPAPLPFVELIRKFKSTKKNGILSIVRIQALVHARTVVFQIKKSGLFS